MLELRVRQLEDQLKQLHHVKYACLIGNGTAS